MQIRRLLSKQDEAMVIEAIVKAERNSSAEIRVHVDRYCKTDPVYKAKNKFLALGMDRTNERNGVLIYVALDDKKAAVVGDLGIDEKVDAQFWQAVYEQMGGYFATGDLGKGLYQAISRIGEELARHFPIDSNNNANELSNDISYG